MNNKSNYFFRDFLLNNPYLNPYGFTVDRFFRNLTYWCRTFPDAIIIGNNKSASNTVFYNLIEHPQIKAASRRENRFFDANYWRGVHWYRTYFPTKFEKFFFKRKTKSNMLILDSSPTCYINPHAPQRIKKLLPNTKLIILFRNPIDYAYSLYHHRLRNGNEKNSFEEVIEQDQERFEETTQKWLNDEVREHTWKNLRLSYISDGIYFNNTKRWFDVFPRKNIHCIDVNDLAKNPIETLNNICKFLNLPYYHFKDFESKNIAKNHPKKGPYPPMNSNTRKKLIEFYIPYNRNLENLLGKKFDWNK